MKAFCLFFAILQFSNALLQVSLFKLETEVKGEEFIYYKIMHPGTLLLELNSLEGDADIYVSDKTNTPTYQPESYDFHAATCGIDSVVIPKSMKRPIFVGIYGSAPFNKVALEVYETYNYVEDHFYEEQEGYAETVNSIEEEFNKPQEKKSASKVKKKFKNIPNSLWPFLELFEMLFL